MRPATCLRESDKVGEKRKDKRKDKIKYIDDGRPLADMSGVKGGISQSRNSRPCREYKEHLKTYWNAVKMMFLPMMVVILIICIAFLIMYFLM